MSLHVDKRSYFETIKYEPHSASQWAYHNSKARFRAPCCGRRFGKSTMAARDAEPELFVPKQRFWIVGPTYDLGEKEFRVMWDDLIVGQGFGKDKRVKKAYNKRSGEMFIEFPWQTRVEVRSGDHPENLVGEALDGLIMSEAAKHRFHTWDRYLRPALADKRGWATFPTTPEGFNWFYNLWQFGNDPSMPDYQSWKFPSWENRVVFPGGREDPEIVLVERTSTPEWFLQEYGADFASFVGKIYGEFDETIHVKPCVFNPAWKSFISFDWGFTQPLAAIWWQVDPWDNVYIWREHYLAYHRLEEHIAKIKQMEMPVGYHLDMAFGDAADPGAASYVSENLVGCYALPEAKENWRKGIEVVKMFLKSYQIGEIDEYGTPLTAPKLFIDHSCYNTIREFNNYRAVDTSRSQAPKPEANTVGAASRQDDHALDAIRYGFMHYFELGVKHHLTDVYSQLDLAPTGTDGPSGEHGYFTTGGMNF